MKQKKGKLFLLVLILICFSAFALADVSFSITAPATAEESSNSEVFVNVNTGGATVAGVSFQLAVTGPAALATTGDVAVDAQVGTSFKIGSSFFCEKFTATQIYCAVTGTSGASGSGSVVKVPVTFTDPGTVTFTLSELDARDDFGRSLTTVLPTAPTSITVIAGAAGSCDATHLNLCITEASCTGANGYWNGQACVAKVVVGGACTVDEACQSGLTCQNNVCVIPAACGDGTIDTGEQCDDRNTVDGDGCSASCRSEQGYTCTGTMPADTVMCPGADQGLSGDTPKVLTGVCTEVVVPCSYRCSTDYLPEDSNSDGTYDLCASPATGVSSCGDNQQITNNDCNCDNSRTVITRNGESYCSPILKETKAALEEEDNVLPLISRIAAALRNILAVLFG